MESTPERSPSPSTPSPASPPPARPDTARPDTARPDTARPADPKLARPKPPEPKAGAPRPGAPAPSWAARLALRVLQAGALAAILVASTYKTFELDRFFIPKELVLHVTACLAGLLALGAVRRAAATRVDALLGGFLVLGVLSALFATNPWAGMRALAVSASGVAVFWTARAVREAGLARPLLDALALAVVVGAATALLQTYGVRTDLFSLNRAPGGTLGNRNFVGHLAAFGLPLVLLSALRAERRRAFVLAALGVAVVAAALVLTRSRAAWLGVIAAFGVLVVAIWFARPLRRDGRLLGRFALLLAVAGLGVAAAIVTPNTLRWTSDTPYLETARGVMNYRDGSGRGRLHQYGRTLAMTVRHPVLGVGPGNWSVVYPAFASRRDPSMNPNQPGTTMNPWPSSDWVALLAERGLLAFALLVLAWAGLARGAWRALRAAVDPATSLGALVCLATLAGAAVVGAFDAVLLLAWPTLLFWAAAGALWPATHTAPAAARPGVRVVALLVLVLMAGAGATRSAGQLAAVALYAADGSLDGLRQAARLDPGNYRVHVRLAQRLRRDRARRCAHALAARDLFPHASQAAGLARRCE